VEYLRANRGDAEYLVATTNSMSASPVILNTDDQVISLGGFMGGDPVFTTDEISGLVGEGAVRFFLVPDGDAAEAGGGGPPGGDPGSENEAVTWVQESCEKVAQEEWQSPEAEGQDGGGPGGGPGRNQALYDCDTGGE